MFWGQASWFLQILYDFFYRKKCFSSSTFHSKPILLMHNYNCVWTTGINVYEQSVHLCVWRKLIKDIVAAASMLPLWNRHHVQPDCVMNVSKCQTRVMCRFNILSCGQKKKKADHLSANSVSNLMFLWDPYLSWSSGYSGSFDRAAENITETLNYQSQPPRWEWNRSWNA